MNEQEKSAATVVEEPKPAEPQPTIEEQVERLFQQTVQIARDVKQIITDAGRKRGWALKSGGRAISYLMPSTVEKLGIAKELIPDLLVNISQLESLLPQVKQGA